MEVGETIVLMLSSITIIMAGEVLVLQILGYGIIGVGVSTPGITDGDGIILGDGTAGTTGAGAVALAGVGITGAGEVMVLAGIIGVTPTTGAGTIDLIETDIPLRMEDEGITIEIR
jgi:hypothetical protein